MKKSKVTVTADNMLGYSYDWDDDYYDYDDDDYYDDYDDDYYDDYYDDDEEDEKDTLTLNEDTLKVGSDYDDDIWLNNVNTGAFATVRVIDAQDNNHNLFITGNNRANSIISGNGQTTLWGAGGGKNTIIGGARRNYFWYQGSSRDVAKNFGTGDTSYSDVVVLSGVSYSSISRDSASITFNMADGNFMQLQPGASYDDDPILFSGNGRDVLKFKIAQNTSTNLTYRNDVNTFYFTGGQGQIVVNGSGHNIWLAGDSGQNYVNANTINAAASSGYNTLMGNHNSNVIIGGSGVSTLWGYYGGAADTLISGEGPEIFRVGKYEGNDVVISNQGHDIIHLYDTNLSDIIFANAVNDSINIGFNTGSQMTLKNTSDVTSIFQLADGSRYNYNRNTAQWQGA